LVAWLQGKAAQSGFTVETEPEDEFGRKIELLRTVPRGRRYFTKDGREEEREPIRGVHHGVDFEGVLRVTDPKTFADAFHKGIGSAKGFGFGLLTIVPLD
jgi:CRISPR system Cascade subunit CasE